MDRVGHVLRWLVILGLLISAGALLLRTEFFTPSVRELTQEGQSSAASTAREKRTEALDTLYPETVLVSFPDGQRVASCREGQSTRQAFLNFSALLGEALGSSGPPQKITEGSFRSGIENGCVFFDLGCVCPLGVLSEWLGAGGGELDESITAEKLYLGLEENATFLCFRDGTGRFFRCGDGVQAETLRTRMADFQGEAASFAYENSALRGVESYLVLTDALPALFTVQAASGREGANVDALAEAVGINSRMASSYYDADNTLVITEDERVLRLEQNGRAGYRLSASAGEIKQMELAAAVELAAGVAKRAVECLDGDAGICFSQAGLSEDTYTVSFDYCFQGIPVLQESGHAFTFLIRNGVIRQAWMYLRCYRLTEEPATAVLPPLQAAAAAAGRGGGAPLLAYMETDSGVRCGWLDRREAAG